MHRWKRWGRGATAGLARSGAVEASSRCVSLDDVPASQPDVVGDVVITETVCQSGSTGCEGPPRRGSPGRCRRAWRS